MSTLEINKIVAAFLTVGVVASFSAFMAEVIMHPRELEEPVYLVAGAAPDDEPAAAEEEAPEDIAVLLASAEEAEGEKVTRKCTACHTFEQGGANKIGPNLWNVVGNSIAHVEDYSYSSALGEKSGDTWTFENLSAFLADPRGFAPGTKMSFAGIKNAQERADLLLYLRSLSDSPAPLPE